MRELIEEELASVHGGTTLEVLQRKIEAGLDKNDLQFTFAAMGVGLLVGGLLGRLLGSLCGFVVLGSMLYRGGDLDPILHPNEESL